MREIKFRAKRIDMDMWVYGQYFISPITDENSNISSDKEWHFLSDGEIRHCIVQDGVAFVIDVETLGEFTGLRDILGNEIYEHDIVSFDGNMTADNSFGVEPNGFIYDKNSVHVVVWDDEIIAWNLKFEEDEYWKYKRDTRGLFTEGLCKVDGIFINL